MIPKDHVTAWRPQAPWAIDAQVEQDLVISRALVEIFCVPELASSLLFRGGTALYKLHFTPATRYSEDIDLVQAQPEPIGDTIDHLRAVLDPWLGTPRRQLKEGRLLEIDACSCLLLALRRVHAPRASSSDECPQGKRRRAAAIER